MKIDWLGMNPFEREDKTACFLHLLEILDPEISNQEKAKTILDIFYSDSQEPEIEDYFDPNIDIYPDEEPDKELQNIILVPRELLERILTYLFMTEDEGPYGSGWKTNGLKTDIQSIEDLLDIPFTKRIKY